MNTRVDGTGRRNTVVDGNTVKEEEDLGECSFEANKDCSDVICFQVIVNAAT